MKHGTRGTKKQEDVLEMTKNELQPFPLEDTEQNEARIMMIDKLMKRVEKLEDKMATKSM